MRAGILKLLFAPGLMLLASAVGGCGGAPSEPFRLVEAAESGTGASSASQTANPAPTSEQSKGTVQKDSEPIVKPAPATGIPSNELPRVENLSPPDPTSWATFRNGNQQLGIAGSTLPDQPELLWDYPAPDGMVAAAAIVGEQVYVGILHGDLLCLDRKTGKLLWKYRSIDDPDPEKFSPGFKASPTVTADMVYIGDEEGMLHAVDRATGKRKWQFSTGAEIAGSVAVVGEKLIFGSHDSYLYCLHVKDGALDWKFQTMDRVNCSPAISGKYTFVAGCDTRLRVIDIEAGQQTHMIPLGEGAYLIASPAVIDNILYVGTHDSRVVAVDWQKGEIVWTYKDPKREQPYHSSAAVTDKFVIVGGQDKQLHCINRTQGTRVWVFAARGQINSSPVVVGDRVFFGSVDGNIYAVGLEDGKERWKYNAGKDVTAAPAVGEGCLVIGTEDSKGRIYCFGTKEK